MSDVEFTVFGPLRATRDGVDVPVGGPRQRAVLAALLLAGGRHVSTDALVDAVWGDNAPATAVKTIQKYVSQLRAQLAAPDLIISRADGYSLPTDTVDSRRFEALLAEAADTSDSGRIVELTTSALRLHGGEPYTDLPDLPAAQAERRRLSELRMSAVETLAEARLALGGDPALIGWLHEQLTDEPLRERLWAALMAALYRAGRQAEALAEFQRLRTILVEQLGTEPSPAVRSLHERILRQEDSGPFVPEIGAAPATTLVRRGPPMPLTSFVGRAEELAALGSALATHRLVTLTGPAGSGKTRLAVELLTGAEGRDACFVELAALTAAERIASAVAVALRVGEQPGRDVRQLLADSLAGRDLLLVLDNCEHLLDATAGLVTDLLRATRRLRILATSRAPLGAEGELIVDVPPLSLPVTDDPDVVAGSEAVQLLMQRARAADGRLAVTPANAAAVARIARRLDGMPLALELAAGRLRVFDPQRLAELLDDRFRVLVSTVRTAPARHQTLRAAISWSYDQLSLDEQELFRALSVFEGGFTLDAAEAVRGASVVGLLPVLVDRSLVVVDRRADAAGYRLLETIREYGRAQLDAEESQALHRRHLDFYLAFAHEVGGGVRGPRHVECMDRLDAERDNLRAALRWALTHGERADGVRLVVALAPYWDESGQFTEGAAWLWEALSGAADAPPRDRTRAFLATALMAIGRGEHKHADHLARQALALAQQTGAEADVARATARIGVIALYQGDYAEALGHLTASRETLARLGEHYDLGEVLARIGHLHRLRGDFPAARSSLEAALAVRERIGDASGAAWARWQLGVLARYQGDDPRAEEFYHRSMAEFGAVGYANGVAHVRYSMADVLRLRGEYDVAVRLYTESLGQLRELGDRRCVASVLFNIGAVGLDRADLTAAEDLIAESMALRADLNDQSGIAECLEGFAAVDEVRGRTTSAVRLLAVADALRTRTGSTRPASDDRAYAARIAALREAIGVDAFDVEWLAGQTLDPDAAVAAR